jgi:hypothetical protein
MEGSLSDISSSSCAIHCTVVQSRGCWVNFCWIVRTPVPRLKAGYHKKEGRKCMYAWHNSLGAFASIFSHFCNIPILFNHLYEIWGALSTVCKDILNEDWSKPVDASRVLRWQCNKSLFFNYFEIHVTFGKGVLGIKCAFHFFLHV